MLRVSLLSTAVYLLVFAQFAQAAERDSRKEGSERAARKACLSGDYAKGVEILSDLFLDTKNPTYIYNQARCYEQNNHCAEAVGRFREYLRKAPNLKSADRTDVEKHIEECESLMGKSQAPAPQVPVPVAAPVVSAPTPPPPAPAAVPTPPVQVQVVAPIEGPPPAPAVAPPSQGYGLLIAGICSGLVGLGSVGAGLYYYDRARYYSAQVVTPDNQNAGKHAENMQWIFYGLGGATLAAGTVMVILGWPSSEPSTPTTSFAPVVGPGMAGIAAQGTF